MRYYKGVNLMDTVTKQYIETVKVSDIPWHRLTTTYGRATDFPAHLEVLWDMKNVDAIDAAGEELAQNIEHQSTLWHATPFAMVFLLRIFKKALEERTQNEVAHYLVEQGVRFIGIDTINADQTGGTEFPVHDLFSEKRLMIGENWAYFDRIDFENPYIIAIPMKVVGCDGSPVRAIAVEWED